eukprot:gnl/TRDRNA2_/TRDRNA2_54613_c0_seq1.p1 gnl/TRDRNA2_/TRDRNA2_54613_c0~~gnl/TRDRNA2_/TRDRNA2_54613_c0_seq1.p1  ORF type:complete len:329 (-),score=47.51 gnl/TRDRNA2_/TRDRNA2_54613_c0_seq1:217-1203(-)
MWCAAQWDKDVQNILDNVEVTVRRTFLDIRAEPEFRKAKGPSSDDGIEYESVCKGSAAHPRDASTCVSTYPGSCGDADSSAAEGWDSEDDVITGLLLEGSHQPSSLPSRQERRSVEDDNWSWGWQPQRPVKRDNQSRRLGAKQADASFAGSGARRRPESWAEPDAGQAHSSPTRAWAKSSECQDYSEGWRPHASIPTQLTEDDEEVAHTTLLLRNLPANYSRDLLCNLLSCRGFAKQYDFVYIPMDFRSKSPFGYAFVNFVSPEAASRCYSLFHNFSEWDVQSEKVCEVSWSDFHQGLDAHIERYRSSPVMHESVPDEYKPAIFYQGV